MKIALCALLLFMLALPVMAADVKLGWDQSSSAGVTHNKIYWGQTGQANGGYAFNATIPANTTYTVSGLAPGTWYFAVTALADTNESRFSNEVSTVIKVPPPSAPGNLKITVTVEVDVK